MTGSADGPPLQQYITAAPGGVVYAVQNGDQFVYIYRDRPPYRIEPSPAGPAPPGVLARRAPSWLLSAQHRVVPFYGRAAELTRLRDWRDDRVGPAMSVRLVHGPGGQGKTRLAAEFGAEAARAGWTVAVARHRSEAAAAGGGDQQLAVHRPGLLIVVDYAERWPLDDLVALLRQHLAAVATTVRVLLLARPGGGWSQSLLRQLDKIDLADTEGWELAPLAAAEPDRHAIYAAARDRFAHVLGLPGLSLARPDLDQPGFELVLALHMKALVDVDAARRGVRPPTGQDRAGLSSYLLDREREYWRAAHHQRAGPVRTSELAMARAVFTATLTRPLTHRDGLAALARAEIGEATTEPVAQVLTDHAQLYPPTDDGTVLEPLYPDRLGEDFLALTSPGHTGIGYASEPWAATLPAQLLAVEGPMPGYAGAAVTVLVEAAARWSHLAEGQVFPLLHERPELALAAGGRTLTRLAELPHPGVLDVLDAVEARLPDHWHVDLEVAAAAITQRTTPRALARTTDPARRIELYATLGLRLARAGRPRAALAPSKMAVLLRRPLAEVNPAVHLHLLAWDLIHLGRVLNMLGRPAQAVLCLQEAVTILRTSARSDSTRLAELAQSLDDLGIGLSALGRVEQAIAATREAVAIHRRLAAADPACSGSPDLARALINLGNRLFALGRHEEALKATREGVAFRAHLAAFDSNADLVHLSVGLRNLAGIAWRAGRRDDALAPAAEAVAMQRRLVDTNPDAHLPGLADALGNLAVMLAALQRGADALPLAEESVELHRRLAAVDPGVHGADLCLGLVNLAGVLSWAGATAEAAAAGEEAVERSRRWARTDPATHLPTLATALAGLGGVLSAGGRESDALAPLRESVAIRRPLADTDPVTHRSELARELDNLGRTLVALGRPQDAEEPHAEAVRIRRELAAISPAAHLAGLRAALEDLTDVLTALGRDADAVPTAQEAVAVARRLADVDPAHLPRLATLLDEHGRRLARLGRRAEAAPVLQDAVDVLRELVAAEPDARLHALASSLTELGAVSGAQRDPRAVAHTAEAVALRRRQAAAQPVHRPDLARALWVFAFARSALGVELPVALAAAQEAAALYRQLDAEHPGQYTSAARSVQHTVAGVLDGLGRAVEAAQVRRDLGETGR